MMSATIASIVFVCDNCILQLGLSASSTEQIFRRVLSWFLQADSIASQKRDPTLLKGSTLVVCVMIGSLV